MKAHPLSLAVGLLLGAIVGYTLGLSSSTAPLQPTPVTGKAASDSAAAKDPSSKSELAPASRELAQTPEPTPEPTPELISNEEFLQRLAKIQLDSQGKGLRQLFKLMDRIPKEQIPALMVQLVAQNAPRQRDSAIDVLLRRWASADPEAARRWVSQLPEGTTKNRAAMTLIYATAEIEPRKALALADKLPANRARDAISLIFLRWAENDPTAAMAHLASISSLQLKNNTQGIYATILHTWSRDDPQGAVNYVQQLPESPERIRMVEFLCYDLVEHDPSRAMQLLDLLPPGPTQDNYLSSLARLWTRYDPEKARAWANLQTDESVRSIVWPSIARGLAESDPRAAFELALSLPENSQRINTASYAAELWIQSDPVAATAYLQRLPDNALGKAVYSNLASTWASNDPAGAARWLNTLPADGRRDSALSSFASATMRNDPAAASRWAMSISDPGTRSSTMNRVARSWMQADPQAAARWIAQPDFPADLRKRLQNN